MKKRVVWIIWVFILIVASQAMIFVGGIEDAVSSKESLTLGSISQVLKDPHGNITFQQLLASDYDESFENHDKDVFQFGLTKETHWIRFQLNELETNNAELLWREHLLYLDYSGIERIELYIPVINEEEDYIRYLGGFYHAGVQDEVGFVFPVFQLPENLDSERPFYIRVESMYSNNFSMIVVERNYFSGIQLQLILVLSLIYGMMLAMMLYNLVLFFALKDKVYILYVGYILFMTLYQVSVTGVLKIIRFEWGEFIEIHTLAATFIAVIFALMFAWSFIDVPRFVPKAKYPAYGCFGICGMGIVLVLSGNQYYANWLAYVLGAILPFLVMTTAVIAYRKGQLISKYYIMATAVLFSTVIAYVLRGVGVLEHSLLTSHAVTASAGMEALLLSFALADRIRILRKHGEQADQRATELTQISLTDSLTSLYNRRCFDDVLLEIKENPSKRMKSISLLYLDIDQFKKFNDAYGHPKGDQVLQTLAKVMKKSVREGDYACRIGGEEFAVIFFETNATKAWQIAERIRASFESVDFSEIAPDIPSVTVSIGVAELEEEEKVEAWVNRADKALYTAKEQGRNRIVVSNRNH